MTANTLLKQLGFADADRRNELHDLGVSFAGTLKEELACLVADRDTISKFFEESEKAKMSGKPHKMLCGPPNVEFMPERAAHKMWRNFSGAQRQLIGFMDGLLTYDLPSMGGPSREERCTKSGKSIGWIMQEYVEYYRKHYAIVEVKAGRVPASDVVRQISAYREGVLSEVSQTYVPGILLHAFDISASEHDLLIQHSILPVRLGARFEAYVAEQKSKPALGLSL